MTMQFRTIKDALNTLLDKEAAGRYNVVGYQTKSKGADEVKNSNRFVQAYYRNGDFDGRRTGPSKHKAVIDIDLTVATDNKVDLSVLDDPDATDAQRAAVITARLDSGKRCDDLIDELFDIIWNIIMDARNEYLGLDETTYPDIKVDSRYVNTFRKDDPIPDGDLMLLTAKATLIFNLTEQVSGDTGVASESIDNTVNFDGDPNDNTGVTVPNI